MGIEYSEIEHNNSDISIKIRKIRTRLMEAYYLELDEKNQSIVNEALLEQIYYPIGDLLVITTNIRNLMFNKQTQGSILELIDIFL